MTRLLPGGPARHALQLLALGMLLAGCQSIPEPASPPVGPSPLSPGQESIDAIARANRVIIQGQQRFELRAPGDRLSIERLQLFMNSRRHQWRFAEAGRRSSTRHRIEYRRHGKVLRVIFVSGRRLETRESGRWIYQVLPDSDARYLGWFMEGRKLQEPFPPRVGD